MKYPLLKSIKTFRKLSGSNYCTNDKKEQKDALTIEKGSVFIFNIIEEKDILYTLGRLQTSFLPPLIQCVPFKVNCSHYPAVALFYFNIFSKSEYG